MSTPQPRQADRQSPEMQTAVALTVAERHTLLEEIARLALMLAGTQPSREQEEAIGVSQRGTSSMPTSPLERLRLLETLWPAFCRVLPACLSQRDSGLVARRIAVPLEKAHGGPMLTTALARTPRGAHAWLRRGQLLPSDQDAAFYVMESRLQTTESTSACRFVCHALHALHREADALARLAAFCDEAPAAESVRAIAEEARRWQQRLLPDDPESDPDTGQEIAVLTPTQIRQAAAWPVPYRHFLRLWQQANRALTLDWSDTPLLSLPLRPEWQLYEIWCFLQVAEALQQNGWHLRSHTILRWQQQKLRLVIATGGRSRLRFTRSFPDGEESLTLTYQPLYVSANRKASVPSKADHAPLYRSRSHAMQPDLALLWRDRLYLLDPKFRAYNASRANEYEQDNALLDDVNKMHAYRDAIVHNQHPVVAQAWCLFPGTPMGSRPIIAFPRATPETPFGSGGVGALRLRPGEDNLRLRQLLASWLTDPIG